VFDIFEEKEPPCLYIADVEVEVLTPSRSKKVRTFDKSLIKLFKYPMVLLNGKFPTKNSEEMFFKKIYNDRIGKGNFSDIKFKVLSIKNLKFSSKLAYKFDFDKH